MQELMNKIKWVITLGVLASLVIGGIIGYSFVPKGYSDKDWDNFREVYHNDYVTTIKLLIQDCSDLSNQSLVVVRHLVDIQNRHLGIIYKCSSPIQNNITLAVQYAKQFYEVK